MCICAYVYMSNIYIYTYIASLCIEICEFMSIICLIYFYITLFLHRWFWRYIYVHLFACHGLSYWPLAGNGHVYHKDSLSLGTEAGRIVSNCGVHHSSIPPPRLIYIYREHCIYLLRWKADLTGRQVCMNM